jgi:hypothetical protein
MGEDKQRKLDRALEMTFPASDPVALGEPTGSEEPAPRTSSLLDKIPQWLRSLHQMENELRSAARQGLVLRKDEATEHLAEARRLLEKAVNEARGVEPPDGPQTPLRKEGEV